jgi:hypothetical protein
MQTKNVTLFTSHPPLKKQIDNLSATSIAMKYTILLTALATFALAVPAPKEAGCPEPNVPDCRSKKADCPFQNAEHFKRTDHAHIG